MPDYLTAMVAAARAAGRLIKTASRQPRLWTSKGHNDFVTGADLASENLLREILGKALPEAAFWGEESGGRQPGLCWIVDPLDGTTNFLHGYPHSAVSLALAQDEQLLFGVVHDFHRGETFQAARGGGAWLGRQRLRVSTCAALEEALLATGFGPGAPAQYRCFEQLDRASRGVRRDSCASLDLAYVAAGRLGGFWELDLKPWDVAAGILLIEEAGGQVGHILPGPWNWRAPGGYLASNGLLHSALIKALEPLGTGNFD